MNRILAIVSLFITLASPAFHAQVQLPDLYVYDYAMVKRDPFISPDAPTTLLTNNQEIHWNGQR